MSEAEKVADATPESTTNTVSPDAPVASSTVVVDPKVVVTDEPITDFVGLSDSSEVVLPTADQLAEAMREFGEDLIADFGDLEDAFEDELKEDEPDDESEPEPEPEPDVRRNATLAECNAAARRVKG